MGLVARIKTFLGMDGGSIEVAAVEDLTPQEVVAPHRARPPRRGLPHSAVAHAACGSPADILASMDGEKRRLVLELCATDSVERLLLLEKYLRSNDSPACADWLSRIRRLIVDGSRMAHVAEIAQEIERERATLAEEDPGQLLWIGLEQLLIADSENMEREAYTRLSLMMTRYGATNVDDVRARNAAWYGRRLRWWVDRGIELHDRLEPYGRRGYLLPADVRLGHDINGMDGPLDVDLLDPRVASPDSTRTQLLAEIVDNPQDDAPRQVYADLIGGEVGALINMQCLLAKRPGVEREAELHELSAPLVRRLRASDEPYRRLIRRGFVVGVEASVSDLLRDSEAREACKGLHVLQLDADASAPDVAGMSSLERVAAQQALTPLFASEVFHRVSELSLLSLGFDNLALQPLIDAPAKGSLTVLDAGWVRGDLQELFAAPALRNLERLSLRLAGRMFLERVDALLRAPFAETLIHLELRLCGLSEETLRALLQRDGLPRLERLDISENPLGPGGASALQACAQRVSRLRELNVDLDNFSQQHDDYPDGWSPQAQKQRRQAFEDAKNRLEECFGPYNEERRVPRIATDGVWWRESGPGNFLGVL